MPVTRVERPFVWIGGVEAARLLEPIAGRTLTPAELADCWRTLVPPARAAAIAASLIRGGVLQRG